MPILVTMDFPGISPEQYQHAHVDVMAPQPPPGMIAHCCHAKGPGVTVIDFWESREDFQAFVEGRVLDAFHKHQLQGEPENLSVTELVNADAFPYRGTILAQN